MMCLEQRRFMVETLLPLKARLSISPSREIVVPISMHKEQTVYMDVFYWKSEEFVLAVLKPLDFYLVQRLRTYTAGDLKEAVKKLIGKIRASEYSIQLK